MRRSAYCLCAAVALLALAVTPALAARGRVLSGTFGSQGAGAGQLELASPQFNEGGEEVAGGSGVAVDEATGDVYVADTNNHRIDEFSSQGSFVQAWGWGVQDGKAELETCTVICQAGTPGSQPGQLETPTFVAIDNSGGVSQGDVYVADTSDNLITKYTSQGTLISSWGNNGEKATPNGQLNGVPTEQFGVPPCPEFYCRPPLIGIAVGGSGELWVDDLRFELGAQISWVYEFEQDGVFGSMKFEMSGPAGSGGGSPAGIVAAGLPLNGIFMAVSTGGAWLFGLNGEYRGSIFSIYGQNSELTGLALDEDTLYIDERNLIEALTPNCPPPSEECAITETLGAGQLIDGAGLAVDSASDSQPLYVAETASDAVDVFGLEAPGVPTVEGVSVVDVNGEGAKLQGEVNPRGLSTSARFEYGPCANAGECAWSAVPAVAVGSDFAVTKVGPTVLRGLSADTEYHYRLVASNGLGSAQRSGSFRTQAAGALRLLDGREWEMVSPPDKQGALILPATTGPNVPGPITQAAAQGGALTYVTNSPTEVNPTGYTNDQQILAADDGASGWTTRNLALPHKVETGLSVNEGLEYRFFSETLSLAVIQPFGAFSPLSAEASESTAYLDDLACGSNIGMAPFGHGSCFQPLVTGKDGYANVPPGTVFGEPSRCPPEVECGPQFVDASSDGLHVIVGSDATLTAPGAPSGDIGIYEWSGGHLSRVSVLPPGEGALPASEATLGSASAAVAVKGAGVNTRHAISNDGSRIFWTGPGRSLYVRYNATQPESEVRGGRCVPSNDACTLAVSNGGEAEFEDASPDGSRVWFTQGEALDECELQKDEAGSLECAVHVVVGAAEGVPGMLGPVLGTSGDGCNVGANAECNLYFVSNRDLATGAVHGHCGRGTVSGLCNLYVVHNGTAPRLVAVLSGEDHPDWSNEEQVLSNLIAQASQDGRWLAFMSDRPLTGYDARDASNGRPTEEAYVYDAQTGRIACVSCDSSGARPVGGAVEGTDVATGSVVDRSFAWEGARPAADLHEWEPFSASAARYQPRSVSNDGRVFFNSFDGLVPKDVNGQWDAYEYEPEGVGSCKSGIEDGGEVYKPARTFEVEGRQGEEGAGCVGLISSGQSGQESAFMDASENGGDVFFMTTAQLSAQDYDHAYDIYDAHECTSESPCAPAPASPQPTCTTADACRAASAPQPSIYGAPSSQTFNGTGDLAPALPAARKVVKKRQPKCKQAKRCHRAKKRAVKRKRTGKRRG
jgi:hypothetical protein